MKPDRQLLEAQARLDAESGNRETRMDALPPEIEGFRRLTAVLRRGGAEAPHPKPIEETLSDWRARVQEAADWEAEALTRQAVMDGESVRTTRELGSMDPAEAKVFDASLERVSTLIRAGEPASTPEGGGDFYWSQIARAIDAESTERAPHGVPERLNRYRGWGALLRSPWLASALSAVVTLGIGARMGAVAPTDTDGGMEVIYVAEVDSSEMAPVYWIDDPDFTNFIEN